MSGPHRRPGQRQWPSSETPQPFTSSPAPCTVRASCTNGTRHRTDSTRCAGISRAPFHEPFHADGRQRSITITERSDRNPTQRRRILTTWLNRTPRLSTTLPNLAVLDQTAPGAPQARRQRPGSALGGPPGRTPGHTAGHADQPSSRVRQLGAAAVGFLALRRPAPRIASSRLRPGHVIGFAGGPHPPPAQLGLASRCRPPLPPGTAAERLPRYQDFWPYQTGTTVRRLTQKRPVLPGRGQEIADRRSAA